ncbi:CvpA family protein [Halomonas caseinilytica]|uniref:Membrane protein required for colicin V production n=1 Tax=Halomonas caseinilytica TaxID=438744 RepID=A0A1M6U6Y4_9GAMM|nr:CvpA family protein [Halomonas caseinilytica]SHK64921.1 membrane protein required for colicin V production [Halomonas caseinilytica]
MALTWLDWLCIGVLAVTTLTGLFRGLIREALGLASWIVALLAARWLSAPVADVFSGMIESPDGRLVLAFVLVVFVVILACGLIIRLMHAAVEWVGMGLFNRLAGAAFGLAKGAAVLVLATILIGLTPLSQLQAWQQAELRPELERLRAWSVGQLLAWEDRLPASASSLEALSTPDEPTTSRQVQGSAEPDPE